MNKQAFLAKLRKGLSGLPQGDVEESVSFYSEMIDDRIEEGMTEEEAVTEIGSVADISAQIIADIPLAKLAKERIKPKRRMRAWEIVLLAAGSPLWLILLIAAFVVLLALYAVIWSVVVCIWSVFGALVGGAVGGIAGGVLLIVFGNVVSGIMLIGAGLACAGLAIFLFFGCLAATKGTAYLTAQSVLGIKKCFVRKEKEE